MRFITNSVMNVQGFTSDTKDVILALFKVSCLYIWGTFIRYEGRTGYPSGDSWGEV